MGSSSSVLRPQELVEFRKLNTTVDNVEIPARAENRTLTDKKGFIIYGVFVLLSLPFLIYSLTKSDVRHILYPTDACGDFCGWDNEKISGIECSGQDLTLKPYLEDHRCVSSCSDGRESILKECMSSISSQNRWKRALAVSDSKKNLDIEEMAGRLQSESWKFFITILATIALSLIVLVMLRFMPGPLIWSIIIFSMIVLVIITILLWVVYLQISDTRNLMDEVRAASSFFAVIAGIWTIATVIILTIMICLFKKIKLVIQLYKEATKALAAMPMLVFVPVVVTIFQIIIFFLGAVITLYVISAREIVALDSTYSYDTSGVISFTVFLNIVVLILTMKLVEGTQFMIISGSVARWFFSRNKQYLDSPIFSSIAVTFRYHLGTVAFGSFILTAFAIVKAIIKAIFRNSCCRCCVAMCCSSVEVILNFLSNNSYIVTAVHGQSWIRSAKRATKLLLANASTVIAVNCVGDFILGMIVFLVTVIATGISFALFSNLGPVTGVATFISFFINLIIVSIMFGTFSTIIDTLFICFCEDMILNDGISRPYYMSRGLMEFTETSKKLYGQKS